MSQRFREVFKSLLLPLPVHLERQAREAFQAKIPPKTDPEDYGIWTKHELDVWIRAGKPNSRFREAVKAALLAAQAEFSEKLAANYFQIHKALREQFLLTHLQASSYLSHAQLICLLATQGRMSSAQIANVLGMSDSRVGLSRQSVGVVLTKLQLRPEFTLEHARECFARDSEQEEPLLADAGLEDSADLVGRIGTSLGCQIDIGMKLLDLCPEGKLDFHPPYLQILHYQTLIGDLLDHRLTDMYEFRPRGKISPWLLEQYPSFLITTEESAFLNNAKAVEALTEGWARTRKKRLFRSAFALYEVLSEMEQLGFSARKELALWIRLWLLRVIRLAKPLESSVPDDIESAAIRQFASSIADGESGTSGILEQRFVDALAQELYPVSEGWISRGLSDPVNATNTSMRKLGDVDFQSIGKWHVVAFEAHAGTLTAPYLESHIQVMRRVLEARRKEWAAYSDENDWTVNVVFVAHKFAVRCPEDMEVDGVSVKFTFQTYGELLEDAGDAGIEKAIRELVIRPVNEKRTPNHVRERFLSLSQI